MKYLILVTIIFITGIKSFAQSDSTKPEWIYIPLAIPDSSLMYMKSEPVSIDENVIRIWCKSNVPKKTIDNIDYKNVQIKDLWEFNCKEQTVRLLSTATYDSDGKVIRRGDFPYQPSTYIVPGSIGETLMVTACKMKK
jgi:hypothetical protein